MKLLRNREIYVSLLIMGGVSAAAFIAANILYPDAALLVLAVCVLLTLFHIVTNCFRYKKLSELAAEIDKILHDDSRMELDDYCEGELALLHSEIYKMTLRLREQSTLLKEDKIHLVDFLADISHQIRTPLTSMNLIASLLEKPELTFERRRELTRELFDLLTRVDWLITSLLKISKLDAGTIKFRSDKLSIAELISRASRPVQIPIELRGQELIIEAEGEFCGDAAWSCEAIGNILKNCMEHTPECGTITVTASENTLYSEIIIRDTGCGIAPEDLPHIFERFYKGKDSSDNSFGIGLALARMIVVGQNGTLKAESPHDGGAKFTMRFYKGTI